MLDFYRTIYLILCLLLLASSPVNAFLKTEGKKIVDSNGQPVLLRGIGLGGWLVPEGYMLHIPGYGSPSVIRQRIVDLIGENYTNEFYRLYEANYVNEKDIALIASWGFNSIRLPFHYRLLTSDDQPGVWKEEGFARIDSLLEWCKTYQLYLILDMHCAPGGQNSDNISDSDGEAKLWTVPANQDLTVSIWREIAQRYATEEWIAGYDLLNEPVMPSGYNNTDLKNLYQRIVTAVREVDNNHIIFLEGSWYATDFTALTPPLLFGSNIVYSFHKYWNQTAASTISNYLKISTDWNVPLWTGESGENSNTWFYEVVQLLESYGIGWCWWTHKKIQTITSPLSAPLTANYQKILDYWNGQVTKPDPAFARYALMEMADNLALDSCRFLPDVLAALTDVEFGMMRKPYKNLRIPGIIPAADYDMGTQGVAYWDKEFKKENMSASDWNLGYNYRNDGVDIEKSRDNQGEAYSVGWTATGEWMKYSVAVDTAGIYDISFRVASAAASEGGLTLYLDDQVLLNKNIPVTGGWYNWQNAVAESIYLPGGNQTLTLEISREGFNINQMKFILKTPNGIEDEPPPAVAEIFQLGQNYPNPFNSGSSIPVEIFSAGKAVELSIFNIAGKIVQTFIRQNLSAGKHHFFWDGKDKDGRSAASGIYFYRLSAGQKSQTRSMILLR